MKIKILSTRGQCYKTFYCDNLPPFHGNTVILCYKAELPWKLLWNGSNLPQYCNPRKSRVKITVVIYHGNVLLHWPHVGDRALFDEPLYCGKIGISV
jgi:hypothetical protein